MYQREYPWEADPIGFLINQKYPRLAVLERVRTNYPEREEQYQEEKRKADAYLQELLAMPPGTIANLFALEKARFLEQLATAADLRDKTRFFSEPFAEADFDYWSKISYWTADEAVALSLGKEPRIVSWPLLEAMVNESIFVVDYRARLELVARAVEVGHIAPKTAPFHFLAWAERTRFSVPSGLVAAVVATGHQIADWKTEYDRLVAWINERTQEIDRTQAQLEAEKTQALETLSGANAAYMELWQECEMLREAAAAAPAIVPDHPDISTRERDTLLKIVIGMAVGGYSYDPRAARSTVIPDIVNDLETAGVAVSDDTVRKYLREAAANFLERR
jgi:hypothetical protein